MTPTATLLQNEFWQAGILPQTGASIAFGRVRHEGSWIDVMRPTHEADYGNASKCASFIMLPWCNRIRDAKLRFQEQEYILEAAPDDGTARHGDVRKRRWNVEESSETSIRLSFDSAQHQRVNFPFHFSAQAEYRLEDQDFVWRLALKNEDTRPMPGGFGHHPYFARPSGENSPHVALPCDSYFELIDFMAVAPPVPVTERLDFRRLRSLEGDDFNDLLTDRRVDRSARLVYPGWRLELQLDSDALFRHLLLFTPPGEAWVAIEPMTNASDGFNLYERGIEQSGVVVLQPGDQVSGEIRLRIKLVP